MIRNFARPMDESIMFSGKYIGGDGFIEVFRDEYLRLIKLFGREKFDKVYDWTFKLLSGMSWEQWIVVERVCPDVSQLPLFYFCVEMVYQSDLFSQFCFKHVEGSDGKTETRIVMLPPLDVHRERCSIFLGHNRYRLIDAYARLRATDRFRMDYLQEFVGDDDWPKDIENGISSET